MIKLHTTACYEEPYAKSLVEFATDLVKKGKAKEGFPHQMYTLSVDWPTKMPCEYF